MLHGAGAVRETNILPASQPQQQRQYDHGRPITESQLQARRSETGQVRQSQPAEAASHRREARSSEKEVAQVQPPSGGIRFEAGDSAGPISMVCRLLAQVAQMAVFIH